MVELNFDTLIRVIAHVASTSDISRIARTCRTLHGEACKELLRQGVYLYRKEQLPSFHQFIVSNIAYAPLLQQLPITIGRSKGLSRYTRSLPEIIICCSWVEDLVFEYGYLMDSYARVAAAICTLRQLRSIEMQWLGGVERSDFVLSHLQSPSLERVSLSYHCIRDETDYSRDPSSAFGGFASSVKTLELDFVDLWPPTKDTPVCSQLTTLQLRECDLHGIAFFLHAFPNLKRLLCDGGSSDDSTPLAWQGAEDIAFCARTRPWKILDYLTAPPELVCSLNIPCPVRHWHAICSSYPLSQEVDKIITAIELIRPSRLHLRLDLYSSRHSTD